MNRATQCGECGCFGHHLIGCPEGERHWELAQMRADEESAKINAEEESETEEPFDAVSEIMANFVSIYGRHENKAILSQ